MKRIFVFAVLAFGLVGCENIVYRDVPTDNGLADAIRWANSTDRTVVIPSEGLDNVPLSAVQRRAIINYIIENWSPEYANNETRWREMASNAVPQSDAQVSQVEIDQAKFNALAELNQRQIG